MSVHDPVALANAVRLKPELHYAQSISDAAAGAHLVLHLTEWAEYRAIDPFALAAIVAERNLIDARCALDARLWRSAGWSVRVLGRPPLDLAPARRHAGRGPRRADGRLLVPDSEKKPGEGWAAR